MNTGKGILQQMQDSTSEYYSNLTIDILEDFLNELSNTDNSKKIEVHFPIFKDLSKEEIELYDILYNNISSGYLYYMETDNKYGMVCGVGFVKDQINMYKNHNIPYSWFIDDLYVLFKGDIDEPDDCIRTNTRFISFNDLIIKDYKDGK